MAVLEITKLRADIAAAGAKWDARELASGEFQRGRGWQPTPPTVLQKARANAERLKRTRLASMFGATGAQPSAPLNAGVASGPAGGPGLPKVVDWRNQGVIAPVTDQERCGSCVSFAVTGLVGAMAAIEHDGTSIPLLQADSHFNSSHGPRCGGWDNGTALNQVQSRGVVGIADEPYARGIDTPPHAGARVSWRGHLAGPRVQHRDRPRNTYTVMDVGAWTGDDRKTYLAYVGPLACGFTVYGDFQSYGGASIAMSRAAIRKGTPSW
jgi:hypothetical protein